MEIILHRKNSIKSLKEASRIYGVEVDIRSLGKDLILTHDPFQTGEKFSKWIKNYNHGTLILNVKEEGLEEKIIKYLNLYKVKSYFFLDQSFPFLIKTSNHGESNSSVRVSEYESIETALKLKGRVSWVWVDTFTRLSLTVNEYKELKLANFKLCLVSPELNSQNLMDIKRIKVIIEEKNFKFDAVCTKFPELWDDFSKK